MKILKRLSASKPLKVIGVLLTLVLLATMLTSATLPEADSGPAGDPALSEEYKITEYDILPINCAAAQPESIALPGGSDVQTAGNHKHPIAWVFISLAGACIAVGVLACRKTIREEDPIE